MITVTKTLYREFLECPKYSWYHINRTEDYNYIQENRYWSEEDFEEDATESEEQQVENLFLSHYSSIRITNLSGYRKDPNTLHDKTLQAINDKEHVIYQWWLLSGNIFTIFDILLYDQEKNGYILLEIKSKNNIRNSNQRETLKEEIVNDISIQNYVLKNFTLVTDVQIGHLNKEYRKVGKIDVYNIAKTESVITEIQDDQIVQDNLGVISQALTMSEDEFDKKFPYDWCKSLLYFWTRDSSRSKGNIFSIPRITQAKIWDKDNNVKAVIEWYENGIEKIEDIPQEDIDQLSPSYKLFIKKYLQGDSIEKELIRGLFTQLEFPLFFYDYETINIPIPFLDNTWPWQQVVCQYSLHRLDSLSMLDNPENIPHFEWLIESEATDNKEVIAKFVRDIGEVSTWTFVVWHKWFECSRNSEIMTLFPEFSETFSYINTHTFDLKDLVSGEHDYAYFLRDFRWSASIKYVLPAMTDMTYDWMNIPNWRIAADTIKRLLLQDNLDSRNDLLTYCKQDTFAMVKIFEKLHTLIA